MKERWDSVMSPVLGELRSSSPPRARVRVFVVAFLRTLRASSEARALMAMSLSSDVPLVAIGRGPEDKSAAVNLWISEVAANLRESGYGSREARVRASALVCFQNGVALTSALHASIAAISAERVTDLVHEGIA